MEHHLNNRGIGSGELDLKNLRDYALYLLENKLQDYYAFITEKLLQENLALLCFKSSVNLSQSDVGEIFLFSAKEFLMILSKNDLHGDLEIRVNETVLELKKKDVGLDKFFQSCSILKKSLFHFVNGYTDNAGQILQIAKEADDFFSRLHLIFLNAYTLNVQVSGNSSAINEKEKFYQAQELAEAGSFEWDLTEKGRSKYSPQAYRILEIENIGNIQKFFDNVHPADQEKLSDALQNAIRGDGILDCEYRYISRTGEKTIWVKGALVKNKNEPSFLKGLIMDVTNRHYTISKLERNERLYKQAQQLAHIGNWTYEVMSETFTCSDELYRILGLVPQSEITIEKFFSIVQAEDRELIKEKIFDLSKGISAENIIVRIQSDAGELKFIKGNGQVLKDSSGRPYKVIGTCQDITREMKLTAELKQREELLEKLNLTLNEKNTHLEDSNKELSAFGYVVSHDLQEPLRKIKLFGDLLLEKENEKLSEEGKMLLGRIINSSGRMQKLINDLLSFSRTQTGDKTFESVDLNSVIDGINTFYEESVNRKKPVITRAELPVISGIAFQVQQLFENIVSNSVKYSKEGKEIKIDISAEETEDETIHGIIKYYKISVADNGIGFEQKYAAKIFEIFQRLHGKAEYSGTGIGLSICKKIIENHSGRIEATGVPQEGARFDIYFPRR